LAEPRIVADVVVRETLAKTVLNHSGRSEYSFNCYTGCS
jgi:hypothetical protein